MNFKDEMAKASKRQYDQETRKLKAMDEKLSRVKINSDLKAHS